MSLKRKITFVCEIVDWEHRYHCDGLQGGHWCLRRVEELMGQSKAQVIERWHNLFQIRDEAKVRNADRIRQEIG